MKPIIVLDCSGSMWSVHDSPMDRILSHLRSHHPPDTPWVACARRRMIRGTVAALDGSKLGMSSGAEHEDAFRYALAPGIVPILCTDDGDDLRSIAEIATGREMELVIARCGAPLRMLERYPMMGRVTYV
jgi:hypothetical protein